MPKVEDGHTEAIWARVDAVVVLILENDKYLQSKRSAELVELVMEKFNVEERTAQRYISEARREVRKIGREKAVKVKETILRRCEYIYHQTKNDDKRLALDTLKFVGDITPGVVPDKKTQTENINYDIDLSKFTERGLERLKRGDDPKIVMLDPESVKLEK